MLRALAPLQSSLSEKPINVGVSLNHAWQHQVRMINALFGLPQAGLGQLVPRQNIGLQGENEGFLALTNTWVVNESSVPDQVRHQVMLISSGQHATDL